MENINLMVFLIMMVAAVIMGLSFFNASYWRKKFYENKEIADENLELYSAFMADFRKEKAVLEQHRISIERELAAEKSAASKLKEQVNHLDSVNKQLRAILNSATGKHGNLVAGEIQK